MPSLYKLLALDMDGTLLSSKKTVLPKTQQALDALAARGVAIAYCTGRNPTELTDYSKELTSIHYGSLVSGGLAYDFIEKKAVAVTPLSLDLGLKILDAAEQEDVMVHFLCTNASVTMQRDIDRMDEMHMTIYQPMFSRLCTRTTDFRDYLSHHDGEVVKINLYHKDEAARERSFKRLSGLPLTFSYAESTSLECTAMNISKAKGLEALCKHLGITMQQVVAVGDANNDTDALKAAGVGVAMGNAVPEIKALADDIVADNDHDGIVEVIDRYFA